MSKTKDKKISAIKKQINFYLFIHINLHASFFLTLNASQTSEFNKALTSLQIHISTQLPN